MAWIGTVTDAGRAMLAQITGGEHTLTILDATAGTGTRDASDLASATALVAEHGAITIAEIQRQTDCTRIWTRVGPDTTSYTVKEIGVWAKVDNGARALFSIHQNSDGVVVPSVSDDSNFIFDLICTFASSNTDNFAVSVDPSSVVTQTQVTDVLRYSSQDLTDLQQSQARKNIGAAPESRFNNGVLPIANGGTGKASGEDAMNGLVNALSLESTDPADDDYLISQHTNGGTGNTSYHQKNMLRLWNYIKSKFMPNGYVPIANGGTGATTVAAARNALGLGNTTGALPIANGGTGGTTVSQARAALGLGATNGALPVANGGTGSATAYNARIQLGVNIHIQTSGLNYSLSNENSTAIEVDRPTATGYLYYPVSVTNFAIRQMTILFGEITSTKLKVHISTCDGSASTISGYATLYWIAVPKGIA